MSEETTKNEVTLAETPNPAEDNSAEVEKPEEKGGEQKPLVNIRDQLTRKAARFLDESEYSDEEFQQLKAVAEPWVDECILR